MDFCAFSTIKYAKTNKGLIFSALQLNAVNVFNTRQKHPILRLFVSLFLACPLSFLKSVNQILKRMSILFLWITSFLSCASHPGTYRASRFTHVIDCSQKAESFFRKLWNKELISIQEEVYVIFVNDENRVLEWMLMHKGGSDGSIVDISLLFKFAYKYNATGIFLAHNHPKGSLKPSVKDLRITEDIRAISERLNFRFLDHIILTKKSYYSFHESGYL